MMLTWLAGVFIVVRCAPSSSGKKLQPPGDYEESFRRFSLRIEQIASIHLDKRSSEQLVSPTKREEFNKNMFMEMLEHIQNENKKRDKTNSDLNQPQREGTPDENPSANKNPSLKPAISELKTKTSVSFIQEKEGEITFKNFGCKKLRSDFVVNKRKFSKDTIETLIACLKRFTEYEAVYEHAEFISAKLFKILQSSSIAFLNEMKKRSATDVKQVDVKQVEQIISLVRRANNIKDLDENIRTALRFKLIDAVKHGLEVSNMLAVFAKRLCGLAFTYYKEKTDFIALLRAAEENDYEKIDHIYCSLNGLLSEPEISGDREDLGNLTIEKILYDLSEAYEGIIEFLDANGGRDTFSPLYLIVSYFRCYLRPLYEETGIKFKISNELLANEDKYEVVFNQ
ncbi:hypothetical protein ENBRE01_1667 [Enteropsectra breve]|nr:hypothetical protein ENBRE01_1667 [Enteropsectra breve]